MNDGPRANVHTLRVDNEPSLTNLISIYPERKTDGADLSVSISDSGVGTLERLRQEQVDYVVSGYGMPDIGRLEFPRTIRPEHPDPLFILFTGKSSEEVARNAFRVGATNYMRKGTDTDQYTVLANRIVSTISQYRAKAASERYGIVVKVFDNGIHSLDSTERFTSADGVFYEFTGYDREAAISRKFADLAAEVADEVLPALKRVVSPNAPDTGHLETVLSSGPAYPHGDGLLCEGYLTLHPTGDDESTVIGMLQDVIECRRRRNRLRYETRLKDAVLDTLTSLMSIETDEIGTRVEWTLQSIDEVADLDRYSVYLYGNETIVAARMHGWRGGGRYEYLKRITLKDTRWLLERLHRFGNICLHHVSDLPPEAPDMKHVFTDIGTGGFVTIPIVSKWTLVDFTVFDMVEASRSWTDTKVDLLHPVGNNVIHILARQRRERELRRQNGCLKEFASVVSHNLRNPLSVAKGFIRLAHEENDVTYLNHVLDGVTRMDTILNGVLTLTRRGRKVSETHSVAIRNIAERAWKAVGTGGDIVLIVKDGLGITQIDQGRFQQALENSFRNTIEHDGSCCDSGDDTATDDTPADETASTESSSADTVGELTVRAGPTETGFYVADNGPGIPAGERGTVFEHDHTTSDSGMGFGLSIVKSITEVRG